MSECGKNAPNKLSAVYAGLQHRLQAALISSGSAVEHAGAKGDETEANWLALLKRHLPHRYQAETGFVMDAQGQQSDQIDIVVYDRQYTPELYNVAGQKLIPAEGVYAVLEVKQALNKGHIEYSGGKVSSVRRLKRSSAPIVHLGSEHEPRPLTPILGGILTTASDWTPPFGEPFTAGLGARPPEQRLDIGCVVNAGGFETLYDDDGALKIAISPPEHALAFFFLRFLHRLQRIGTVPAIDYDTYLAAF